MRCICSSLFSVFFIFHGLHLILLVSLSLSTNKNQHIVRLAKSKDIFIDTLCTGKSYVACVVNIALAELRS